MYKQAKMSGPIKIEAFVSIGCSSLRQLEENIRIALAETGAAAEVNYSEVDEKRARDLGLRGSPTVRINGKDIGEGGPPGIA